ncbi:MAG: dihydrolipoamide acetyltransferase family protein [Ignavibacteriales bacterium]
MIKKVVLPKLGLTMTEGRVAQWLVPVGSAIKKGDLLFTVETEKTSIEIEAPADGVFGRIVVPEGETVPVGTTIGYIATEGETEFPPGTPESVTPASAKESRPDQPRSTAGEVKASPLARKIAEEHGLSLSGITGTGPGGRITKEDVLKAVATRPEAGRPTGAEAGAAQAVQESRLVEITQIKRITGERLSESARNAPHFFASVEVDCRSLKEVKQKIAAVSGDIKVSITALAVRGVALALRRLPGFNASFENGGIRMFDHVNIAVATDTSQGLTVPVIRDADRKSVVEIAREMAVLAERARAQKLTLQDLEGATFTVSNLGMFGVTRFTAIINPPQAAILSVGAMVKRPVVEDDRVVIAPVAEMTLSSDHRVIDGAQAGRFLSHLKGLLENAYSLLI